MEIKPGTRLKSSVDDTEIVVVKPPSEAVDLRCGGHPMSAADADAPAEELDPQHAAGTLLGKRYADPNTGLEVLCTKAGSASLSLGDQPLELKDAKPLPSSD